MDDKKVPVLTKDEAISKLRLFQSLVVSQNWEDKECVVALQMGIHAIQQPELVRCPDCRFKKTCINTSTGIDPDGFCKWGRRKEGDGDG